MAIAAISECTCPPSNDIIICAKCGGTIFNPDTLTHLDKTVAHWMAQLDLESRLNSTLATYMAIDRQMREGVPVATAVRQATQQMGLELNDFRSQIERSVAEAMDSLRDANDESTTKIRDILKAQVESMVTEIRSLVEQGKSVKDVEARVREVTLALQNYMTAMRLPRVKGEEGETNIIRDLQDAFMGQSDVRIEPVGGADSTDAVLRFYQGEIEIGRSLVEVKSRKTWSNDYMDQVRNDMNRYNTPFAMLAVDKLPKTAKSRGFHVDIGRGVVITAAPELVVPTMTMFFQIHAASYAQQKRALDFQSLATDGNLVFCINDNMRILDDCKKISDVADDSDIFFYQLIKRHAELRLRNRIVWHYAHGQHAEKRLSGRYETILWFTKGEPYTFNLDPIRIPQKYPGKRHFKGPNKGKLSSNPLGKNPSDVWELLQEEWETCFLDIPNVKANHREKTIHPAQFPVELVERFVLALTNPRDKVFDPFVGVGSTLIAALLLNRRSVGVDRNKQYIRIARRRIRLAVQGKLKLRHLGTKKFVPGPNLRVAQIPPEWTRNRRRRT